MNTKPWHRIDIVVPARPDKNLLVFVHLVANVFEDGLTDEKAFLQRLKEAVTDWLTNTPQGRDALAETENNFHFGELELFVPSHSQTHFADSGKLIETLERYGIKDLKMDHYSYQKAEGMELEENLYSP